jgi:hypothetical protein
MPRTAARVVGSTSRDSRGAGDDGGNEPKLQSGASLRVIGSLVEDSAALKSSIEDLCFNSKLSDVQLLVAGEVIPAHKVILASRSPYFRSAI